MTVSFPATSIVAAGSYTMFATSELAGDSNTGNDTISGVVTAVAPIDAVFTVAASTPTGTTEYFASNRAAHAGD